MSKQLRELQARKSDLVKEARALTDIAAQENRDLSDEDVIKFNALKGRIEATSAAIDRESALISEEVQMGTHSGSGSGLGSGSGSSLSPGYSGMLVSDNRELDPKHGFQSLGDFLQNVCHAQKPGNPIDDRLLIGSGRGAAAPASFGSEGSGQDGGFFVPPQFSKEIFQLSLGEDSLLPLTDNVEISGNTMAFPKDETTPWGTNGIRAYWQGEAAPAVTTKPVLGLSTLRLKKLMALVPTTDELLEDANALSTYLPEKIALSIRWKTNESILFGSGSGVPVGALNAGATVSVAKETGQATQTLLAQNLAKMIARLPNGSFANSVWIVNNDVLPALFTLPASSYTVDAACEPARITPVFGQIWPPTLPQIGSVGVIFDAGYGAASDVPAGIKSWIKLRVGSLYSHREEMATLSRGRIDPLPFVDGLLDGYRVSFI